jgi:hypothetical protein
MYAREVCYLTRCVSPATSAPPRARPQRRRNERKPHPTRNRAPAPTATPPGARPQRQRHTSIGSTTSGAHAPTAIPPSRVTIYDPLSISEIDMGYGYGRSDINGVSIGMSMWDMGYRSGISYIDTVIHHIDMVVLDIDMGYGLMIWEMTVSIRSSPISKLDILSPCLQVPAPSRSAAASHVPHHGQPSSRGLHLSACPLNVSAFGGTRGIEGVLRGYFWSV